MIIVRADTRHATCTSDDAITTGSVGIQVKFMLSGQFNGLSAVAVFRSTGACVDVALMSNTCVVPPEVLRASGAPLYIGVYARNSAGTVVIPTVWTATKDIQPGTRPSGVNPSEPTPDWTAQVQLAAQEAVQTSEQAIENSERAIEIAGGAQAAADDARQSADEAAQSATAAAASEAAAREVEESIPADYTDLSNDVSELKSQIALVGNDSITKNITMHTGGAINSTGAMQIIAGNTTWAYSDFIPVPAGCGSINTNAISASTSFGLAFYDESQEYIAGTFRANYSSPTVEVIGSYKFIRLTNYSGNSQHNVNITFVDAIGIQMKEMNTNVSMACNGAYRATNLGFVSEKAINSSGQFANATGYPAWAASDFIAVPENCSDVTTNAVSASNSFGLAFYDETKTFIAGSFLANYASPTVPVVDGYKYIRISSYVESGDHSDVYIDFNCRNSLIRAGVIKSSGNLEDVIGTASVLSGTYTLSSVVTMTEGQCITGSDCVVNVVDGGKIIMKNGCSIAGIRFVGTWNPTREAGDGQTYTSYGYVPLITLDDLYNGESDALFGEGKTSADALIWIDPYNAHNTNVDGCRFENLDRLAVFAGGQRHQEKTNPIVCNNYFSDCRMGVYVHGEFERIYGNKYLRCIIGCYLFGGNSNTFGELMTCCDCGYYFPNNATAHNEITSCEVAHSGLAGIYLKTLSKRLGCQVTGSQFVDAPIIGDSVSNLMFVGCRLDTLFDYASGEHNAIMCSNVGKSYMYGKTTLFDVPNDTLITLNVGLNSVPSSDVNWTQ